MTFDDVVLESRPCPLGCSSDDERVVISRDRIHNLPGEFSVVRCRQCDLMRTNPRPTPESMGFYYPDDYGPYVATRIAPPAGDGSARPPWKRKLHRLAAPLVRMYHLPPVPPGRLLEIGCASGSFLREMASRGWEVEGIELSETASAAARAAGFRVHTGSPETSLDVVRSYDLIVGWMVLEHLHDPITALQKLRACASPGSWLVVSTPNVDAYERRLFKDAWLAWHLPNHLYHFSPRTLTNILDRGGWTLEKVFHQRQLNNLIGSTGYVLKDKNQLPSVAERLIQIPTRSGPIHYTLFPLAYLMSLIGQTGRMTVWARQKR